MKNLTNEEFVEKLKLINPTITPLEKFTTTKNNILVKNNLNIVYKCNTGNLLSGIVPTIKSAINKTDAFIKNANIIHNNKYTYEKCNYINSRTKVTITCPIHGDFEQTPSTHIQGSICKQCSIENTKTTIENFITIANKIHQNKYDYSLSNYINAVTKIKIICKIHGVFFQTPHSHISSESGCPKCGNSIKSRTQEDFIKESNIVHNYKYDYSSLKYINCRNKVKIICPEHGEFEQLPQSHLKGNGCKKCGTEYSGHSITDWIHRCNKKKNKFPLLYIINCFNKNENFIKIGITSNTIKRRYGDKIAMPYNFSILYTFRSTPEDIFKKEKMIFKQFKKFKYLPKLYFAGQNECFLKEIKEELLNLFTP